MRGLLSILLMMLPFSAQAEGARLVLTCTEQARCDASGACVAEGDSVGLTIAPERTDDLGAGTYSVTSAGGTFAARALERTGPFLWDGGDALRHVLTLTSERGAVLIRYALPSAAAPSMPEAGFLDCEVTY